jgi:hypothetical protein
MLESKIAIRRGKEKKIPDTQQASKQDTNSGGIAWRQRNEPGNFLTMRAFQYP